MTTRDTASGTILRNGAFFSHAICLGVAEKYRYIRADVRIYRKGSVGVLGPYLIKPRPTYHKERHQELRRLVLLRYSKNGDVRCVCCDERRIVFLTLDHIEGGGRREKKAIGGNLYARVKRQGFPPGFQVLCFNCNCAKHDLGVCPHKSERTSGEPNASSL